MNRGMDPMLLSLSTFSSTVANVPLHELLE